MKLRVIVLYSRKELAYLYLDIQFLKYLPP